MRCTKCGRDTAENAVFCESCTQTMAKYPVKPGTVIQLPQRKPAAAKKSIHKRQLSPEEQILRQRRVIRWLWVALISTLLLLSLSVVLLFQTNQQEATPETIGQNYMTREVPTR